MRDSSRTKFYDGNRGVLGANPPVVIGKDRVNFGTAETGKVAQDIYMQMSRPGAIVATKAQTPMLKKNGGSTFS